MVRGRVLRISDLIASALTRRAVNRAYPFALGLSVFLAYPSLIGIQDVAAFSQIPLAQRWLANIPETPGSAVFAAAAGPSDRAARLGTPDSRQTASTSSPARKPAIVTGVTEVEPQRINRAGMGDRVVSASVARPPAYFSAGSILERQSMLAPEAADDKFELAFVTPKPADEVFLVASVFHRRESGIPTIEPDLPVVVASLVEESVDNVLAYNQEPRLVRSPFAAVLESDEPISLIPKIGKDDHGWADDPLPLATYSDREQNCLTAGVYFESRGESVRGQAAVAQVILNRVRNPAYPDSACAVVYQNKNWRNKCQFSFACDGVRERVNDPKRWKIAQYVARETTEGRIWLKEVGSSTHYHATYVRPRWARTMQKVAKIGLHVFYRTFGGGWS